MEEETSYLDLGEDLGEIPDEKTVPGGEYELRLAGLTLQHGTKNDPSRDMLVAQLEVVGEPLSKIIYHYLLIPKDKDIDRTRMRRKRAIKRFYTAFGMPLSGPVKFEEYINSTAWGNLTEEEDDQGRPQNRLAAFTGEVESR